MTETVDQRLLHDAEQAMLAQMGKPPSAAEWAVFWRGELNDCALAVLSGKWILTNKEGRHEVFCRK